MTFCSTDPQNHNSENTWFTPKIFFDVLGPFDIDIATTINRPFDTAKEHLCVEEVDSLSCEWRGYVWANPPYGKELTPFVDRFLKHKNGVMLIFARMGSEAMQKVLVSYKKNECDLFFLRRRIAFIDKNGKKASNAGTDSLLVLMGLGRFSAIEKLEGVLI